MVLSRKLSTLLLFVCECLIAAPAAADFANYRSIFVDRFDFTYNSGNIPAMTSQINTMMQQAADEGFTEVVWQVRGRADALYNSNYEPHVSGLTPGFDPLQTAIDAAHARGLKLHAWMNATPMWNTTALNPPAGHIFHNTDPSFRLMDINGNLEPQQGWSNYSSVNPILPEVHTHINNVARDIATNYAVDGIHLDYIRYIPGTLNFDRLPHDPISHQMFQDATGLDGSQQSNFAAYKSYITGRITDLVRSLKETVDTAEVTTGRPMELTASVWRDPDVGKNDYMQDYRTWLEQDLLDVAMPMIYLSAANDHIYFDANLANTLSIPTNARISPNLASYLHVNPGGGGVALTLSQMQRAYQGFGNGGSDGIGFYDFPAFFNGYSAADRQAIKDFFDNIGAPPQPGPGNVLDDFEVDEGHFNWPYNQSPPSQTFGLDAATTIDRVETEHQGAGVAAQLLNLVSDGTASWQIRHNSGIGTSAAPDSNVPLVSTGHVGFWLKTDEPGITVHIALDDPSSADRGTIQNVIADNMWHLYQWNLEDDAQWDGWVNGDGSITGATVTIDSIFFYGSGNAQIYLDTVSHNPNGPLAAAPIAGDYNRDGTVDAADYDTWRGAFGSSVEAGSGADGNSDGTVDAADYVVWRKQVTAGGGSSLEHAAVPEPSIATVAAILLCVLGLSRRLAE